MFFEAEQVTLVDGDVMAEGVPLGTPVQIRVFDQNDGEASYVSGGLGGTLEPSSATASVVMLERGFSWNGFGNR